MSIAAFGRDRNVDEKAVRKAIASGRIPAACVGLSSTGRRQVIADVAAARLAWDANAAKLPHAPAVDGDRQSLSEASRQATMERFRKLRIENDLREGRVVDVRAAKREAFESARIIRESVLNLPARIAAELAAETDPAKVFARLDDALREALGDAADRLEAAGE
jgi:acetylglutamate kinase